MADEAVLRVDLVPAPLGEEAAPPVLAAIADIIGPLAAIPDDAARAQAEQKLLLDALIGSAAVEALRGVVDAEIPFTIETLVENGAIVADTAPLFESLLGLLGRFGAASQADRVWTIQGKSDLPAVPEVWRLSSTPYFPEAYLN